MSDYFDRVEQGMREAVRAGAHLPWYARLRPRPGPSRSLAVALACLVATGSALAATGVLRTGEPVAATVPADPNAQDGVAIPATAHLLALRVPDPQGGPPWGLRILKTTRGLTCVQLGRIVDDRIGVLGQDGAFADDGAFHPLSLNFFAPGFACGTDDADGHAFVNEQIRGLPASALLEDQHHTAGGCYSPTRSPDTCPAAELRDVFYGLLGPDASSVTTDTATGRTTTTATAGGDGAYLVVLPYTPEQCSPQAIVCSLSMGTSSTGGPQLEASEAIRAVHYRDAATCLVPTAAEVPRLQTAHNTAFRAALRTRYPAIYKIVYHRERYVHGSLEKLTPRQSAELARLRARYPSTDGRARCPAVGYAPPKSALTVTAHELASRITVHVEPARFYCEHLNDVVPCEHTIPNGYRRIEMRGTPPEMLLVVEFTARIAVTNYDSHYEINTTDPDDPSNPQCPSAGAGAFGPTQEDLRAGQHVRYTEFVDPQCRGITHVTVAFVTVDGPSAAMPVPGLPGQSAEIPVGATTFLVP